MSRLSARPSFRAFFNRSSASAICGRKHLTLKHSSYENVILNYGSGKKIIVTDPAGYGSCLDIFVDIDKTILSNRYKSLNPGADPDPDSIGSVDPDSESGSGSRRAKMTHKSRKKILSSCSEVLEGLF
jgi:hypothetical protein